jgi:hypothetical protein
MAKAGDNFQIIATQLGHDLRDVEIALSAMRTRLHRKDRATLNAGLASYKFVETQMRKGEPVWECLDRFFTELVEFCRQKRKMRRRQRRAESIRKKKRQH